MIHDLKIAMRKFFYYSKFARPCYERLSAVKCCVLRVLPDEQYLKIKFYENTGEKLDLKNPRTFNMKMQWLKLHNRNPLYTQLADKYSVRSYVEKCIGKKGLNELYGVYSSFDEIDFESLPSQFVMKCTHDCGSVLICRDKKKFDFISARKKISRALKKNYYWEGREWPYKDIKPRIIIEKYLHDDGSDELKDYKVFCFHGIPQVIQVDFDRFRNHRRNLYDTQWNYLGYTTLYPTDPDYRIAKPVCLEKMLEDARKLSEGIPFVRVDFYVVNDVPLFGEMTFFHGGGMEPFKPKEWDYRLGKWLELSRSVRRSK